MYITFYILILTVNDYYLKTMYIEKLPRLVNSAEMSILDHFLDNLSLFI